MNRGRFAGFAIAAAIMLLDGFDIVAMSLAAPHVMPQFGLSPGSMGVVFSALLVGLGLGSMLLGPLGDRFGRRPTVLGGAALLALTTLATIASDGVLEFAAWRFATGLALGLCLTNTTAMVAELSPPERRAATVALVSAGMPLGVVAAGLESLRHARGGLHLRDGIPDDEMQPAGAIRAIEHARILTKGSTTGRMTPCAPCVDCCRRLSPKVNSLS